MTKRRLAKRERNRIKRKAKRAHQKRMEYWERRGGRARIGNTQSHHFKSNRRGYLRGAFAPMVKQM